MKHTLLLSKHFKAVFKDSMPPNFAKLRVLNDGNMSEKYLGNEISFSTILLTCLEVVLVHILRCL